MNDSFQRIFLLQAEADWRGCYETLAAYAHRDAAEAALQRAERSDPAHRYRLVEVTLYGEVKAWWE